MNKKVSEIVNKDMSKSKKMIELYNAGLEINEIKDIMQVRYNFVYNVISNECRKNGEKVRISGKVGVVKSGIIELIEAGKSNTEISAELKVNYNRVWSVRKEYELSK